MFDTRRTFFGRLAAAGPDPGPEHRESGVRQRRHVYTLASDVKRTLETVGALA